MFFAQKYNGTNTSDTSDPVSSYDYDLSYDPIGNRKTYTDAGDQTDYTANALNQYTQISTLTDPQHDLDGNMTLMPSSSGDWDLTWNAENRLVEAVEHTVEDGSLKLQFTYDYKGRRIQKQVYAWDAASDLWSLTSDLRYVYNGWNVIYKRSTKNNARSTVKTYPWGIDLSGNLQGAGGVGGLLSVTNNKAQGTRNTYYVTYDANGNVSEYIDSSGTTVAHYEYSPFGKLTVTDGSMAADFNHRFSTKYRDSETGLYYYGYRYFPSEFGR